MLSGPNPQAFTSGPTVMSNTPSVSSLIPRASRNTSKVGAESGNGLVDACALKRDSSESAWKVDISAFT